MYKLLVTLYLITNGVPAEQPSGKIPNRQVFQTQEECVNFFNTDTGKQAKSYLETMVGQHGEKFKMDVSCVEVVKGESL